MIRYLALAIAAFLAGLASAKAVHAEELVTAISSDLVSIRSNFTGTDIVIFGQVSRDVNSISRSGDYDLVIVVEGPPQEITTRRKGRFLGVWVNRYYETFENVPAFYALASTAKVSDLGSRELLDEYRIGLNHLNLAIARRSSVPLSERDDFRQAFLRLRQQQGLFSERPGAIEFLTSTMFRTNVPLPANIPVGTYKVKSFLLHQGSLLSKTEAKMHVAKTGFEQVTYNLAQKMPVAYGLLAVFFAIFTGWLASVIFKRD
ncbi:TIGR02186 family protein [Roseibium aggregatum]|uniref:TIGR02186 family protein n=1 Tax=Roseibium aggregatum TaxID=187304 RepID=A0A926P0H5_9HYPH|nr:TIGR02186 family protein [Roseibium aggregatum]MBD1547055.1 TIGR02186 family protein [Roseibium aggregatum]